MAGNDSIQVARVTNNCTAIKRKNPPRGIAKSQKNETTFVDKLKKYFKFAREVNSGKWATQKQQCLTLNKKA